MILDPNSRFMNELLVICPTYPAVVVESPLALEQRVERAGCRQPGRVGRMTLARRECALLRMPGHLANWREDPAGLEGRYPPLEVFSTLDPKAQCERATGRLIP